MTATPPDAGPPPELVARLRQAGAIVVTSHVNPDGDSVGSSVGLARICCGLGKRAVVWHRDPAPTIYGALEGVASIHLGTAPPPGFPDAFDLAVVLECPSLDRAGLGEALRSLPIANIDHHLGNQSYGSVDWVDVAAPAVAVLVLRLARALDAPLDAGAAQALYLALSTDTGGFRFTNATAPAFEAAAELVRAGARPALAAEWIHESQPAAAVRLLGEMLRSLELHAGGRVAYVELRPDMFERAAAVKADAEGLIDVPRSISGVAAVALLRHEPGAIKGSLRSRDPVDVERIARRFGGGGHRNAAGFSVAADPTAVKRDVLAALAEAFA